MVGGGEKKLSDINILLPLQSCADCRRGHKLVTAINGCYEWKVSDPRQIELKQFPSRTHPECTNVVEVSSKMQRQSSNIVWLTARDKSKFKSINQIGSSQVLTAQIKVAAIAKLDIDSKMRQVAKNDKIHLLVRAVDGEGNSISSLDGLQFDWQIESGHDHVRTIAHKDSSHQSARGHTHLDESVQGDELILKTLKTGNVRLSVRIVEPTYSKLQKASLDLTIVEPFIIQADDEALEEQGDVVILPLSQVQLSPFLVFKEELNGVTFSKTKASSYHWSISNPDAKSGQVD